MQIFLLRHGIAEDGAPDTERALTEEGWKRLRRAAPAWGRLVGTPDLVLCSPLRRARETADVLCKATRYDGEPRIDPVLLPDAAASLAASVLSAEGFAGSQSIALVGHEPHLGYLLGLLLTGHPRQPIPLKKGMLVGVETTSAASLIAGLRFALTQRAAAELG